MTIAEPYTRIIENPLPAPYTHYEIQTIACWKAGQGEICEPVFTREQLQGVYRDRGTIQIGLYGRIEGRGAEWLADFNTVEEARERLRNMGVIR